MRRERRLLLVAEEGSRQYHPHHQALITSIYHHLSLKSCPPMRLTSGRPGENGSFIESGTSVGMVKRRT